MAEDKNLTLSYEQINTALNNVNSGKYAEKSKTIAKPATSVAAGKILTSNGSGDATWENAPQSGDSVTPLLQSGTQIATVTKPNGSTVPVYAPQGSGGGGTSNYNDLTNKPIINGSSGEHILVTSEDNNNAYIGVSSDPENPNATTSYVEFDEESDEVRIFGSKILAEDTDGKEVDIIELSTSKANAEDVIVNVPLSAGELGVNSTTLSSSGTLKTAAPIAIGIDGSIEFIHNYNGVIWFTESYTDGASLSRKVVYSANRTVTVQNNSGKSGYFVFSVLNPAHNIYVAKGSYKGKVAEAIDKLSSEVAGKAASSHTHAQSDITGLETALAGKASASDLTDLALKVNKFTPTVSETTLIYSVASVADGHILVM